MEEKGRMNGIDISHARGKIDLSAVPGSFVIMKATQGTEFVDPRCDRYYQTAKRAGKKLGVYHYYGGGEPEREAEHFVKNIEGYLGEALLVLDWEKRQNGKFKAGPKTAVRFLDYVYRKTKVKPLIYMSKSVCRRYDWSEAVEGGYALWMAQYRNPGKVEGYQENPWTDRRGTGAFREAVIHQYTSRGRLAGYDRSLDLDIAYMSAQEWDRYAKGDRLTV